MRRKWNFERSWHPGDVDRVIRDTVFRKRCHGPVEQLPSDGFVPPSNNDAEAVSRCEMRKGNDVGHGEI
jgi:hypothetical protein